MRLCNYNNNMFLHTEISIIEIFIIIQVVPKMGGLIKDSLLTRRIRV